MGLRATATRWAHDRWQRVTVAGVALAAAMLALFVLLFFMVIPAVVERLVIKQSELVEGSEVMERWKNPKFKMQFKVFVFSVRNPDEVLNGARPIVKETGPYVWDKVMKHEVTAAGNGTVTFKRKVLYFFNEKDSCPTCILGNRVWVPNIIYQKFVEVASKPAMRAAATTLLAQTPFLELEVGDLLFRGYKDPFLENFCDVPFVNVICQTVFALPERIGLFYGFNNSYVDGEYTVKDGTMNIRERGDLVSFEGMDRLRKSWWSNEEARVLKGNEGSLFHPFVKRDETLWTFSNQLCRALPLVYEKDTEVLGIPTYRFRVTPTAFDYDDNPGYCHATDKVFYPQQNGSERHCYPHGIMQVAKCRPNEPPAVLSMPNFHLAPEEVRQSVEGLNATDEERDSIIVDVEPTLGMPVRAHRAMQINIEFWAGKDILLPAYHTKQRSTLIPIVIVHDDAEIDDETLNKVKLELIMGQRVAAGACYLLLLTALALLAATGLFALYKSGLLCGRRSDVYAAESPSADSDKTMVSDRNPTKYKI
ncbi:scav-2 [Pristionchus pacificus]|uniref:Scav-2 n=1 Tax=Pristionchus pacificus TaxID=54126 RepID=A0A2A6C9J4_PRIPA|nr:scav-2 [Pristionchus pacificus]|eukprot:PDM74748.1 scav-2 [Pristionchus pacificus]